MLEPHNYAEDYNDAFIDLIKKLNGQRYTSIGGMFDSVPHTRPLPVTGSYKGWIPPSPLDQTLKRKSNYVGPTSMTSQLSQILSKEFSIETLSLMVHIPLYIKLEDDFLATYRLLETLSKNQILKELEKFKISEIPENLIEQEVKILSGDMKEDEIKKNKKDFEEKAKKRIKIGLILNEFAQQNNIKVEEHEIQLEVQKQIRMMPGQEKMVMEFYQKNPSALASIRGNVYEEKIIKSIMSKAKASKKDITKEEAEKILKAAHDHSHDHLNDNSENKKTTSPKKPVKVKKAKSKATKAKIVKKVVEEKVEKPKKVSPKAKTKK